MAGRKVCLRIKTSNLPFQRSITALVLHGCHRVPSMLRCPDWIPKASAPPKAFMHNACSTSHHHDSTEFDWQV